MKKEHICVKSDSHHELGKAYILGSGHEMPGWVFVRCTGQYAQRSNFKPLDNPLAMAAVENRKIKERL